MLIAERLHTFLVFSEEQNLSRAARRLHLSQPAVHAQVKALSEELGVPLYQRVGRGLVLTEEGLAMTTFARESVDREASLRARLGKGPARAVVLAAGSGALVHLLGEALRSYCRGSKGDGAAALEVMTADASAAIDHVRRGRAHVGVAVLDAPPAELVSHVLVRARQVVVVPVGHRLAIDKKSRPLSVADLRTEPLILPPEGGAQRAAIDAAFADHPPEHVTAVVRGWDVVLRLATLGVGVGIVNDTCSIPRTLVARPLRELPVVTYRVFHRAGPREESQKLVDAIKAHTSV